MVLDCIVSVCYFLLGTLVVIVSLCWFLVSTLVLMIECLVLLNLKDFLTYFENNARCKYVINIINLSYFF